MESQKERYGYDDISRAVDILSKFLEVDGISSNKVRDGIILGSGLGKFVEDQMEPDAVEVDFNEIFEFLGLPPTTSGVAGHSQKLVIGPLKGENAGRYVIAQSGREHPYEGVSTRRSIFWLRIMQLLGVETLFGSNAVGIVTPDTLKIPSLMLVHSDRDFSGDDNPLIGPNDLAFGPRFPHCGDLYPAKSRALVKDVAKRLEIPLAEGTLFRIKGPQYESAETIYWLRGVLKQMWEEGRKQKGETRFDGDPVGVTGMSSTYEHLAAQQASQRPHPDRVFGKGRAHISVATNYAAGLGEEGPGQFPTHIEVQQNSLLVQEHFGALAREVILEMRKAH